VRWTLDYEIDLPEGIWGVRPPKLQTSHLIDDDGLAAEEPSGLAEHSPPTPVLVVVEQSQPLSLRAASRVGGPRGRPPPGRSLPRGVMEGRSSRHNSNRIFGVAPHVDILRQQGHPHAERLLVGSGQLIPHVVLRRGPGRIHIGWKGAGTLRR
jgi:hypothetical protein